MKEQVCVIVVDNNVVDELWVFDSNEKAEEKFKNVCSKYSRTWDTYSEEDIAATLDDGYEEIPNGSVCIVHPGPEGE
jgi:hypothetical protein